MTFIIFIDNKKVGHIQAKDLEEAKKLADINYPNWTDIYIGDRNVN